MRIYKMTATFGKLEHAELTLEPGLNVITAPNEWGKSTWCAFLVAMLYGLDTRAKTTKTALADKERFAPWSGSPMAGRIDLNWDGRDITIERSTKRRVPLGEFRAYETASGISVPELSAANCGQLLLGVEQSVFRRAGFIKHSDLPVTQDEALRRRLNALVTTGDDSGAADRLAASLKELKNRCRYNRTGLIPQMEARRQELEDRIGELETLHAQNQKVLQRLEEVKDWLRQLYNHQQALAYDQMAADADRVTQAGLAMERMEQSLQTLEDLCARQPSREEAEQKVRELRSFRDQWNDIHTELRLAPPRPLLPAMPAPFTGKTWEEAQESLRWDIQTFHTCSKSIAPIFLVILGLLGLAAAAGLAFLKAYWFAAAAGITGLIALIWGIWERSSAKRQKKALIHKYGDGDVKRWADPLRAYERQLKVYREHQKDYEDVSGDLEVRLMVLRKKRDSLCGDQEPEELLDYWQRILEKWDTCLATRREVERQRSHYASLSAMLRKVEKPMEPDQLTHSEEETARLINECAMEQQRLQNRLGQYQGRMELLGSREELDRQILKVNTRIAKLEETYAALNIAQETLAAARAELQRRFAPRITQRAQELLTRMTQGRYHSLTMSEDFSLQAGAGQEETLHDALWRSDGTVDQLYLSLRLAVAEELTPEAPLILDDALVRFDDQRMAAAVEILKEIGEEKQILCFTCQGREGEV